MEGWTEQEPDGDLRRWRGPHRSVLSLGVIDPEGWLSVPDSQLRELARKLASAQEGGLIEAFSLSCGKVSAARLIYKRLQMPAYVYTGMFITRPRSDCLVWTIVDGECGTTGVREAVVTAELFGAGKLKSIQDYEYFWAQDPYDKTFRGVDHSVLRFMSDSQEYDSRFPDHPLSRVRRFLDDLCVWIQAESDTSTQSGTVN